MNGLDIEMGTLKPYNEYYMADSLLYFVRNGKVPMEKLDDKVRRVLKLNLRTAMNRNRPVMRSCGATSNFTPNVTRFTRRWTD